MKRLTQLFIMLLVFISGQAYDFKYEDFYYNVVDLSEFTVEITRNSDDPSYFNNVDIVVPEFVSYQGREFKVIGIGANAFFKTTSFYNSLEHISMPNTIEYIGDGAFYNCIKLKNIEFPASLKTIDDKAFYNCESIESITIPVNVEKIGLWSFVSCHSLTEMTIVDGEQELIINSSIVDAQTPITSFIYRKEYFIFTSFSGL